MVKVMHYTPEHEYNQGMEAPVTARTALLQALREGPGYGLQLIDRAEILTGGKVRLSQARVYPVLQLLARQGLLRAWTVTPRGRRGARSRTYYELTPVGVRVSSDERAVLASLVGRRTSAPAPTPAQAKRMGRRVLEAEELSSFGEALRSAAGRARG